MDAKLIMTVEEMKNHENWLKMRTAGIGGSDAAAVIGLSRWKSPFQVWMEKTGQVQPEDLSDNEYVYWGTVLEQAVADRFCEVTGKKVRKQGMLKSADYPYILANVDRMIVGENAGLECKTANGFAAKEWVDDQVPTQYYVQCQHYMMVTGCETWYIACLIGGNHFVWKEIPRNEEDIRALREDEVTFWTRYVLGDEIPPVDGSKSCESALKERFPGGQLEAVDLPPESEDLLSLIDTYKTEKKTVETSLKEAENKLCLLLGDNEIGYAGERKVTWKLQNGRVTLDSKKLKSELPDIFDQYKKVGKPTRVLRV
ncbi:MAG: YqaJ viral recombinase family protein [Megasphaera cerevisiae]|jgi:putative phage-type endonuclease|nr:YqaJ viral recombinase family protein [Megasphaera cerevisiae]